MTYNKLPQNIKQEIRRAKGIDQAKVIYKSYCAKYGLEFR